MENDVIIGASVPLGLAQVKLFERLKLGQGVLTWLPMRKEEALSLARYCRQRQIRLYFSEWLIRGSKEKVRMHGDQSENLKKWIPLEQFYCRQDLEEMMEEAGPWYGGRMALGEAGGVLYWPQPYTRHPETGWRALPSVDRMDEAKEAYLQYLRELLEVERSRLGRGPLISVDPSLAQKYLAEAGWDVLGVELLPTDSPMAIAAARGAARAYKKTWGTHIAMQWYGGISLDPLWLKRWRTSLDFSYIAGANFIWPESGHYEYDRRNGPKWSFHSDRMKRTRRILRETYQFSRVHRRPPGGPRRGIGIMHGHLDGSPGGWNKVVWGQYGSDKWLEGPAEWGWRLLDQLHRRAPWSNTHLRGEQNESGNPPFGQYDIVPAEAPLTELQGYRALVFAGWNTMTAPQYEKLKAYVRGGGRLLMFLPQLSTNTDRATEPALFQDGDIRDLFGVRITGHYEREVIGLKSDTESSVPGYRFPCWGGEADPRFLGHLSSAKVVIHTASVLFGVDTGVIFHHESGQLRKRPFLIENRVGLGTAFLVTAWHYPGDPQMQEFAEELLRAVSNGEQGTIRLLGPDFIRYAVYDWTLPGSRRQASTVYLLNTDPDAPATVHLRVRGRETGPIEVAANSLRLAFVRSSLVLSPEDRRVDVRQWTVGKAGETLQLDSVASQKLIVSNCGPHTKTITVNGRTTVPEAGMTVNLRLARKVNPERKEFYDKDFLEEPEISWPTGNTPY